MLGGRGSFQARSTEARTQQRKRVVRMGAVDLPAASGWTEQKSAWEVRPERQGGHVLDEKVAKENRKHESGDGRTMQKFSKFVG